MDGVRPPISRLPICANYPRIGTTEQSKPQGAIASLKSKDLIGVSKSANPRSNQSHVPAKRWPHVLKSCSKERTGILVSNHEQRIRTTSLSVAPARSVPTFPHGLSNRSSVAGQPSYESNTKGQFQYQPRALNFGWGQPSQPSIRPSNGVTCKVVENGGLPQPQKPVLIGNESNGDIGVERKAYTIRKQFYNEYHKKNISLKSSITNGNRQSSKIDVKVQASADQGKGSKIGRPVVRMISHEPTIAEPHQISIPDSNRSNETERTKDTNEEEGEKMDSVKPISQPKSKSSKSNIPTFPKRDIPVMTNRAADLRLRKSSLSSSPSAGSSASLNSISSASSGKTLTNPSPAKTTHSTPIVSKIQPPRTRQQLISIDKNNRLNGNMGGDQPGSNSGSLTNSSIIKNLIDKEVREERNVGDDKKGASFTDRINKGGVQFEKKGQMEAESSVVNCGRLISSVEKMISKAMSQSGSGESSCEGEEGSGSAFMDDEIADQPMLFEPYGVRPVRRRSEVASSESSYCSNLDEDDLMLDFDLSHGPDSPLSRTSSSPCRVAAAPLRQSNIPSRPSLTNHNRTLTNGKAAAVLVDQSAVSDWKDKRIRDLEKEVSEMDLELSEIRIGLHQLQDILIKAPVTNPFSRTLADHVATDVGLKVTEAREKLADENADLKREMVLLQKQLAESIKTNAHKDKVIEKLQLAVNHNNNRCNVRDNNNVLGNAQMRSQLDDRICINAACQTDRPKSVVSIIRSSVGLDTDSDLPDSISSSDCSASQSYTSAREVLRNEDSGSSASSNS